MHRRLQQRSGLTGLDRDRIELRDPPVVITGSMSASCREGFSVRRPIILVYAEVCRRDESDLCRTRIDGDKTLFVDMLFDHATIRSSRFQRSRCPRSAGSKEEGESFTIRRPAWHCHRALQVGQPHRARQPHVPRRVEADRRVPGLRKASSLLLGDQARSCSFRGVVPFPGVTCRGEAERDVRSRT